MRRLMLAALFIPYGALGVWAVAALGPWHGQTTRALLVLGLQVPALIYTGVAAWAIHVAWQGDRRWRIGVPLGAALLVPLQVVAAYAVYGAYFTV